ncbi:hypothetical protein SR1949_13530 [Sphaerospermopsis reniformis]|uniref:Uncharacterized protein n=1 Tax=Sphaerospermopsis reniformis TaxID=531300 RepID=A0A479ZYQ4_9CYAN|nr:hypothetical protein SR1949_13530 [Sphaerospermopsis reniformis]
MVILWLFYGYFKVSVIDFDPLQSCVSSKYTEYCDYFITDECLQND